MRLFIYQAILDKTPAIHPEHDPLQRALAAVKGVASYVNETQRAMERRVEYEDTCKNIRGLPKVRALLCIYLFAIVVVGCLFAVKCV